MTSEPPEHRFDPDAADRFRPRPVFTKTAVLVEPVESTTILKTSFGEQTMRGSFYAVADGEGSYGAARDEFESTHELVGPHLWIKRAEVLAYPATDEVAVVTRVDGEVEARVVARPGDWIVRQAGSEVMVVEPDEFADRYEPTAD